MTKISNILIANRGEIAVRIAKTASRMGVQTTGIFTSAEAGAGYLQHCDNVVQLEGNTIKETYLNIDQLLHIAEELGCDAIHPGYGFMAENAAFAGACQQRGIIFIGPEPEVIAFLGHKQRAKDKARSLNIPVLDDRTGTFDTLTGLANNLRYPVLIKAAAGGGGKGMRIANNPKEFLHQLENAAREAKTYFGDDLLYVEQFLDAARHIEVQLLGDQQGNVVHLYHRECSLQRRYQKVVEEAPAQNISEELSQALLEAAVKIGKATGYSSAGTVEFLVQGDDFYFLEMNARIQVEHPVTELITGVDIVEEQIRVAEGLPLSLQQDDIVAIGHAVESRVYAENPADDFKPSPGILQYYEAPDAEFLRVDTWVESGTEVSAAYDSLLAKVITFGDDRADAIAKQEKVLQKMHFVGLTTNQRLLRELFMRQEVRQNNISTQFIEKHLSALTAYANENEQQQPKALTAALAILLTTRQQSNTIWQEIGYWRMFKSVQLYMGEKPYLLRYQMFGEDPKIRLKVDLDGKSIACDIILRKQHTLQLLIDGKQIETAFALADGIIHLDMDGQAFAVRYMPAVKNSGIHGNKGIFEQETAVQSPLPGTVSKVMVKGGQAVKNKEPLFVIEAMKMDNYVRAQRDGAVLAVHVKEGDAVAPGQLLMEFDK